MKTLSIQKYENKNINNYTSKQSTDGKAADTQTSTAGRILAGTIVGIGILGTAYVMLTKNRKPAKGTLNLHKRDKLTDEMYYDGLVQALNAEGITCKAKDLQSIVAPKAFRKMVRDFKPEHYVSGSQVSESKLSELKIEDFYENLVKGNFRVSLHTHSNFSDGRATPEEFLECARKYADKVAEQKKGDNLPPFTIALTDHDCVDGCREIIKLIAKNPEKYKNLKFIAGCEFSVKDASGDLGHYDITGLALNPFDKDLVKMLHDLRDKRLNTIKEFIDSRPEYNGKKITLEELAEFEKEQTNKKGRGGKRTLENGSGVVSVRHAAKFYTKYTGVGVDKAAIKDMGHKDLLTDKQVLDAIDANGGYGSLTHPIKSFWEYIGDEKMDSLLSKGLSGIEANHQYSPKKIAKLGQITGNDKNPEEELEKITKQYKEYAEKHDMFLSGGTDSHEKHVFANGDKHYENNIMQDFLNDKVFK